MTPWLAGESRLIAALQRRLRSNAMNFICVYIMTALGTHSAFLYSLPLCFWLTEFQFAFSLTMVVLEGVIFTGIIKDAFCIARPFSPPVQRLLHSKNSSHPHEYGLPSTHACNSASIAFFLLCNLSLEKLPVLPTSFNNLLANQTVVIGSIGIYAVLLPLSRVYCGMHSFTDIMVGSILGLSIVFLQDFPLFRNFYDTSEIATGFSILFLIWVIIFGLPSPKDACPCWFDSICASSVLIGVVAGAFYRTLFSAKFLLPSDNEERILATVLGVSILLTWKVSIASIMRRFGKPVWIRLNLPLKVAVLEVTAHKKNDEGPSSDFVSTARVNELAHAEFPSKKSCFNDRPRLYVPWYALEAIIKIISYSGIGFLSAFLVPFIYSKTRVSNY